MSRQTTNADPDGFLSFPSREPPASYLLQSTINHKILITTDSKNLVKYCRIQTLEMIKVVIYDINFTAHAAEIFYNILKHYFL